MLPCHPFLLAVEENSMFRVSVTNNEGKEVSPYVDTKGSPAEYFAGVIFILVDLLNGGNQLNDIFEQSSESGRRDIKTTLAPQAAMVMFIQYLHGHPAFDVDIVFQENNINYPIFKKIGLLLKRSEYITDTSTHIPFLNLVSQIKVEGIKSVVFTTTCTKNQEILYSCNFPDELVPEDYTCLLTGEIMDNPCFDKRVKHDVFEKNSLLKGINAKKQNPYTKQPMTVDDIETDTKLQAKINGFVEKVQIVFKTFLVSYNEEYKKREEQICSICSPTEFKQEILKELLQEEREESLTSGKISNSILIEKNKNLNPLNLYNAGLEFYKKEDYTNAILQIDRALKIFKIKRGKHSNECFQCHDSIIACYRNAKNFDVAIEHAEKTITSFYKKTDLSRIILKYGQCLESRGDTPRQVYDNACENYHFEKYEIASYQLLFAINKYDRDNNQKELSYCHSTLASCYRNLGSLKEAVEHCEQALSFAKAVFSENDKPVKDIQAKLEKLTLSLENEEQNSKELII